MLKVNLANALTSWVMLTRAPRNFQSVRRQRLNISAFEIHQSKHRRDSPGQRSEQGFRESGWRENPKQKRRRKSSCVLFLRRRAVTRILRASTPETGGKFSRLPCSAS